MTDADWRSRVTDAAEVVYYLLQKGVDLLALGEVDAASMQALSYALQQNNVDDFDTLYCDGAPEGGARGCFDIGGVYRPSKISSIQRQYIIHDHLGARVKVAVRLQCTVGVAEDFFYFFISHWPSRLRSDAKEKRDEAAVKLKTSVENIRMETGELYPENQAASLYPYIVLLGDYNDEPFDTSLSNRLHACRDRGLASKSNNRFYNPYWRFLGDETPCAPEGIPYTEPVFGTHSYSHAGQLTRWFTFNQIVFSSAFLGNSEWTLDETKTGVERPDMLKTMIKEKVFDHFPVIGSMVKLKRGHEL